MSMKLQGCGEKARSRLVPLPACGNQVGNLEVPTAAQRASSKRQLSARCMAYSPCDSPVLQLLRELVDVGPGRLRWACRQVGTSAGGCITQNA